MRAFLIALTVLLLTEPAFGQQGKPGDSDQLDQFSHPITKRQLLELPRRDKAPKITLKPALKIAERFISKEKIDISSCYLFEVKWVADDLGEEPSWHLWWVGLPVRGSSGKDIRVTVSMQGKAQLRYWR